MTPEILNAALNGGVGVVLAIVVIYWYRQDAQARIDNEKQRTSEAKQSAREQREDKILMMTTLKENTKAINELIGAVRDIGRR